MRDMRNDPSNGVFPFAKHPLAMGVRHKIHFMDEREDVCRGRVFSEGGDDFEEGTQVFA